jgi:hypothetical protein
MDYKKHYEKLIERGINRATSKKDANILLGYSEGHHITPKCMGGTNNKSNIVYLTAREHYVAHQLLVKIYPDEIGLVYACMIMSRNNNGLRINSRTFEWVRKRFSEAQSQLMTGQTKYNCERVHRRAITMSKQTKQTSLRLQKMAETNSIRMTGQTKENCERVKKLSEAMVGKYLGETKENSERVKKMAVSKSKKMTGQTKDNCERVKKMAETNQRLTPLQKQHLVELRLKGVKYRVIQQYFLSVGTSVGYTTLLRIFKQETGFWGRTDLSGLNNGMSGITHKKESIKKMRTYGEETRKTILALKPNHTYKQIANILNASGLKINAGTVHKIYHREKQLQGL